MQENFDLKICVIGLGYIGLPTAAIVASRKMVVTGVDVNLEVVETINSGKIHIIEPDLDIIVRAVVSDGYLKASNKPQAADIFLIAVPTPLKDDYQPDLSYIFSAVQSIADVLKKGDLVILESTSPVGTTEQLARWLMALRQDLTFPLMHGDNADVHVAYCPERVLPGRVLYELVHNDRIIGGLTDVCAQKAVTFYQCFVTGQCIITSARTAEMCKITENSFRDVNIAFANELAMVCDELDIDVQALIRLANRHPRVNILRPGPGVGGHCIAVDPWFIVSASPKRAVLTRVAREVNDAKPMWVIDKVVAAVNDLLIQNPEKISRDVSIACFGITFKADIDDLRESPALSIVETLTRLHSGPVYVIEPHVHTLPESLQKRAQLCPLNENLIDVINEIDIVVFLVNHVLFQSISMDSFKHKKIIDLR